VLSTSTPTVAWCSLSSTLLAVRPIIAEPLLLLIDGGVDCWLEDRSRSSVAGTVAACGDDDQALSGVDLTEIIGR
jgi:hypothetical protein